MRGDKSAARSLKIESRLLQHSDLPREKERHRESCNGRESLQTFHRRVDLKGPGSKTQLGLKLSKYVNTFICRLPLVILSLSIQNCSSWQRSYAGLLRKSGKGVARNVVDTHGGLDVDVTDTDYWGQNGGVTHCRVFATLKRRYLYIIIIFFF